MRKLICYIPVLLAISSCVPIGTPIVPGAGGTTIKVGNKTYTLVWTDEFNYTGLPDPAKWKFETGFVRNQEVQYYTDNRLEKIGRASCRERVSLVV